MVKSLSRMIISFAAIAKVLEFREVFIVGSRGLIQY